MLFLCVGTTIFLQIRFCGRPTQAAPAVGIGDLHQQQVNEITTKPFSMK